jgi:hypothetical protein
VYVLGFRQVPAWHALPPVFGFVQLDRDSCLVELFGSLFYSCFGGSKFGVWNHFLDNGKENPAVKRSSPLFIPPPQHLKKAHFDVHFMYVNFLSHTIYYILYYEYDIVFVLSLPLPALEWEESNLRGPFFFLFSK